MSLGLRLGAFVRLASYSHIPKASAEQLLPCCPTSKQSEANYPEAYGATRTEMILCGLRPHFLPPDANHVTSTGVPYHPADEHILSEFHTIWMAPSPLVNRAQQAMQHGLRSSFEDKMFSTLNKGFPAFDLLQKYWQYLFNQIHRNRSLIIKYAENWFMSPLATADDLHAALHQFQAIQTCKNILEYKPPMDPNVEFVAHLLQDLRRNVDAVPSGLHQDFISVLDDLIRVCQPGVHLASASLLLTRCTPIRLCRHHLY